MADEQFSRERIVPGWNESRLASVRVVLIGAGALGCEVSRLLALSGCGELVICDPDLVELSNLTRGGLFRPDDIGRPKAQAAADALRVLAPWLRVAPRVAPLVSGVGLTELERADLVISCLDSIRSRIELSGRCGFVGRGLLDAGTQPWGGEVRWFPPGGACFACTVSPGERSVADDPWSCLRIASPTARPASAVNSALVGGLQALTAVRLLLGMPSPRTALVVAEDGGTTGRESLAAPARDCFNHARLSDHPIETVGVSVDDLVGTLRSVLGPDEKVMSWAVDTTREHHGPGALNRPEHTDRSLREMCIAPEEILPVHSRRDPSLRYIRLSA